MCRGVFAMTWFFLLASTLVNVYLMYSGLMSSETENQGTLMDAEEAFYMARNFEYDFKRALSEGELRQFHEYWSSKGTLTHGYFQEFPEKECIQSSQPFEEFVDTATLEQGGALVFSPTAAGQTCVTLAVDYGKFKTLGVIKSTVCVNTSSPLFLC